MEADGRTFKVNRSKTFWPQAHDLVIIDGVEVRRPVQDGGHVTRQIRHTRSGANDQWRDTASGHDDVGLGAVNGRHRERASYEQQALAHRFNKVGAVGARLLDEVGQYLRVRARVESVTARFEFFLQLGVILNDAVVHDTDVTRAVKVRVGVFHLRRAVRGPTGVANARSEARGRHRTFGTQSLNGFRASRGPGSPGFTRSNEGNPGGVVAAILQAGETFEQRRQRVGGANDSDDAAHATSLLGASFFPFFGAYATEISRTRSANISTNSSSDASIITRTTGSVPE